MKSYYSIKLTRNNVFRLYFIKENNWGRGEANGKRSEKNDW